MEPAPAESMRGRISLVSDEVWDSELTEAAASVEIDFAYESAAEAIELRIGSSANRLPGLGHQALDEVRVFLRSQMAFCRETQSSFLSPEGPTRGVETWEAIPLARLAGPEARALCLTGLGGPDARLLSGIPVAARVRPTKSEQVPLVPSLALLFQSTFTLAYRIPSAPVLVNFERRGDRTELVAEWPVGDGEADGSGTMHFRAAWWPAPDLSIMTPGPGEFTESVPTLLGVIASPVGGRYCLLFALTEDDEPVCFGLQAGQGADGLSVDDQVELDLIEQERAVTSSMMELDNVKFWTDLEVVAVRARGHSWAGTRTGAAIARIVRATITDIHDEQAGQWLEVLLDPPLPSLPGANAPHFLHLDGELARAAKVKTGDLVAVFRSLRLGENPMGWIDWVERVRDGATLLAGRPWEFPLGAKPILDVEDSLTAPAEIDPD
jgi:hypothetical protein